MDREATVAPALLVCIEERIVAKMPSSAPIGPLR
jgi:hypothetical protein